MQVLDDVVEHAEVGDRSGQSLESEDIVSSVQVAEQLLGYHSRTLEEGESAFISGIWGLRVTC